jgi:hypothetical protein
MDLPEKYDDIMEYKATETCKVKLTKGSAYHPRDGTLNPGQWHKLNEGEKVNFFTKFSIEVKQPDD